MFIRKETLLFSWDNFFLDLKKLMEADNKLKDTLESFYNDLIKNVDYYKQIECMIKNKDIQLYKKTKIIQDKKILERSEQEVLMLLATMTKVQDKELHKIFINGFNDPKNNTFEKLIACNKTMEEEIDTIKNTWEKRSYFATIPSEHFIHINNFLNYLLEKLKNFLKEKTKANPLIKSAINHLESDRNFLILAMLSRLHLAKANQKDDVVLATINELKPFSGSDRLIDQKALSLLETHSERYNFLLSSELCQFFYNYIHEYGNALQKMELLDLYKFPAEFFQNLKIKMPYTLTAKDLTNTKDYASAEFKGEELPNANFCKQKLFFTHFKACKLPDSLFRSSFAFKTDFIGSFLSGADFQWAFAREADFSTTKLHNANFHGANVDEANFKRASFKNTSFILASLHRANFSYSKGSCNFDQADLSNALLIDMHLHLCSFQDTKLTGAIFIKDINSPHLIIELNTLWARIENHAQMKPLKEAIMEDIISKLKSIEDLSVKKDILSKIVKQEKFIDNLAEEFQDLLRFTAITSIFKPV